MHGVTLCLLPPICPQTKAQKTLSAKVKHETARALPRRDRK